MSDDPVTEQPVGKEAGKGEEVVKEEAVLDSKGGEEVNEGKEGAEENSDKTVAKVVLTL